MFSNFDFKTVSKKQIECEERIWKSVKQSSQLADIRHLIEECNFKQALSMLDFLLGPNKEPIALEKVYSALILRSNLYCELGRLSDAKNDLEKAVMLMPNVLEAYWRLSNVEKRRGQTGRAEVALLLGLKVDPGDEHLNEKLAIIRAEDKVLPSVSVKKDPKEERKVRDKQNIAGIEFSMLLPKSSDFVKSVLTGSLSMLKKMWKPELKEFTFGTIKSPLMHLLIHGATRLRICDKPDGSSSGPLSESKLAEYKAVIDFLFDQGCRLDARDEIGYTAVSYATCMPPQPDLLEYLLSKGADPNLQSVFGCHPLVCAVQMQNCQTAAILLRYGANPHLGTNDGVTPHAMAGINREMVATIEKYTCPKKPGKVCNHCGALKVGLSRCAGCRVVFYCSKRCQAKNWAEHKTTCKVKAASHKRLLIANGTDGFYVQIEDPLKPVRDVMAYGDMDFKSYYEKNTKLKKAEDIIKDKINKEGNIIVKVQIPLGLADGYFAGGLLLVYNQDRSFCTRCSADDLDGKEVVKIIKDDGVGGLKAYFWAFMEPGKQELVLVTDPVLPAQSW